MNLLIDNKIVNVKYANDFKTRFFGLMGKKVITHGIFFPNCKSVHTFFMKNVIDIVALNGDYKVIAIYKNCKKNRIIYEKNAKHIIEFPKTTIGRKHLKINDYIKIVNY